MPLSTTFTHRRLAGKEEDGVVRVWSVCRVLNPAGIGEIHNDKITYIGSELSTEQPATESELKYPHTSEFAYTYLYLYHICTIHRPVKSLSMSQDPFGSFDIITRDGNPA